MVPWFRATRDYVTIYNASNGSALDDFIGSTYGKPFPEIEFQHGISVGVHFLMHDTTKENVLYANIFGTTYNYETDSPTDINDSKSQYLSLND